MHISLRETTRKSISKDIDFAYHADNLVYNNEEIKTLEPVKVTGIVSITEGVADVKLTATTKLLQTCSRCLEEFEKDLHLEIDETISGNIEENEELVPLTEDGVLDLRDVVNNSIFESMPIKILCKEDCKGLCQNCGMNLNLAQCDCVIEEEKTGFSALKDIFEEV